MSNKQLHEIRSELFISLGKKKSTLYLESLRKWARGEITIFQFHTDVSNLLDIEQLRLHHKFVREFGKKTQSVYENNRALNQIQKRNGIHKSYTRKAWEGLDYLQDDNIVRLTPTNWLNKINQTDPKIIEYIQKALTVST